MNKEEKLAIKAAKKAAKEKKKLDKNQVISETTTNVVNKSDIKKTLSSF